MLALPVGRGISRTPSMTSTASRPPVSTLVDTDSNDDREMDRSEQFSGRWDVEAEMNKSLKIQKQKKDSTLRLRKLNNVHDRLLEGKIQTLETNFSKAKKELYKETNHIRQEIRVFQPYVVLPRIESTSSSLASRSGSRMGDSATPETVCNTCVFGAANSSGRCKHFPCFLPVTYNSLGFQSRPQTYSVVKNYRQLLRRCKDARPMTSMVQPEVTEADVEDATPRSPRVSVQDKERGLKQLVKEMKQRNERTKPRDWATNYGAPVKPRTLLKPVIPT